MSCGSEIYFSGGIFKLLLDGKQQREMRSSMGPAHSKRFNPKGFLGTSRFKK